MKLTPVVYKDLNARQQESYNFQKVSGILADYGFTTIRLSDDWQGADFIAQHIDGMQFLKIQLKGRCSLNKKYIGKNIYLCFNQGGSWYLAPHDELIEIITNNMNAMSTDSWVNKGEYHFPSLSAALKVHLQPYILLPHDSTISSN